MKDLVTSLVTNLHILVVSILLVGLGLGAFQTPTEDTGRPHSAVIEFPDTPETEVKPYVVAATTNPAAVLHVQGSGTDSGLHL